MGIDFKIRVYQNKAKRLFNEGQNIYLIPSNCSPLCNTWIETTIINNSMGNFEKIINEYSYYNCNSEMGNKIHFYIIEE